MGSHAIVVILAVLIYGATAVAYTVAVAGVSLVPDVLTVTGLPIIMASLVLLALNSALDCYRRKLKVRECWAIAGHSRLSPSQWTTACRKMWMFRS